MFLQTVGWIFLLFPLWMIGGAGCIAAFPKRDAEIVMTLYIMTTGAAILILTS